MENNLKDQYYKNMSIMLQMETLTFQAENCSVDMAVCSEVTNGTDCVGGIVGWCQSGAVITECAFHGDISYRDSRGIFGGICGYASRSTIINCETTGSVRVRDEKEYPAFKDYDGRFLYG